MHAYVHTHTHTHTHIGAPPGSLRPMGFGDRGQGPGGGMMAGQRGPMGRGAGRGNSLEGKRIRIMRGFDKGKIGTVCVCVSV